jgi:hypothetical protein
MCVGLSDMRRADVHAEEKGRIAVSMTTFICSHIDKVIVLK